MAEIVCIQIGIAIILKYGMEKRMKIWEDDNQKYIKAMMEKNTTEQNGELTKRLEKIDFSVLEHI